MKPLPSYAPILSLVVALGGAVSSVGGLWWEEVYARERASLAAQAIGQDVVTLALAVPALVASTLLARRASLRARLVWLGLLAYFVYAYFQYTVLTVYNGLFLVYVVTYSVALILLMAGIGSLDLLRIKELVPSLPGRTSIGGFLIAAGVLVGGLWLGLIVPALLSGARPALLEDQVSQSLVVQAMDLGLVVPAAVIGGVTLLRNRPLGYLLAAILLTKIVTLGCAVLSMIIVMNTRGVPVAPLQIVLFSVLVLVGLGFAVQFFRAVPGAPAG